MPRRAILLVSGELLVQMAKRTPEHPYLQTVEVLDNPLPDDATIVRILASPWYANPTEIAIVLESAEFDDIPDDAPPPTLPSPTFALRYHEIPPSVVKTLDNALQK